MPLRSTKDYSVGIIYFLLFILTIPAMNWVVMNVGTVCTADGPCLIPVWPGVMAPSGVLMAGVALVLRDGLQAKLGVRWSLYAIIIGAAWVQIGLCVVVFLAGLQSIPQEMYEAASIDGATPSQQLKNITIPMMASSITINVITTTIAAFKAYELPYLISKGLPGHSTLLITQRIFFFGFQAFDYGRGSALSVVLLLIIALISLVQLVVLRKREDIF